MPIHEAVTLVLVLAILSTGAFVTLNALLEHRRKMAEIERGESDIDPYALTNEAEFFAVATEYFLERPDLLQQKHPELFDALERIFRLDLASRAERLKQAIRARPPKIGRNSRCPCGSGIKFKKCCLKHAR